MTKQGNVATSVGSDARLRELEDEGEQVFDYVLTTGETHLVFDGATWLIERPDIGPHEVRR